FGKGEGLGRHAIFLSGTYRGHQMPPCRGVFLISRLSRCFEFWLPVTGIRPPAIPVRLRRNVLGRPTTRLQRRLERGHQRDLSGDIGMTAAERRRAAVSRRHGRGRSILRLLLAVSAT